jgi:hypothetical protein
MLNGLALSKLPAFLVVIDISHCLIPNGVDSEAGVADSEVKFSASVHIRSLME